MATFVRTNRTGIIYLHHHIDGRRFRVSTGVRVDASSWDSKNGKATNSQVLDKKKKISINAHLKQCNYYLMCALSDLEKYGGGMPKLVEFYKQRSLGNRTMKNPGNSFMPYFYEYYKDLEANKKSTFLATQTTYRRLQKFFGDKNPKFSDIDLIFYKDFTTWLETKEKLSKNTISSQFKTIKTVMNLSLGKLHNYNEFKKFKRIQETSDNIALTQDEVNKISDIELTGHLDRIRDLFLIQVYTGTRYSDIHKVNYTNIDDGLLTYRAQKTDEKCQVRVHPKVIEILDKYEGVLPKTVSNQKYNEYIKDVGKKAELNDLFTSRITKGGKKIETVKKRWEELSSHTGRRTFATLLVLEAIPVHLIMAMTGHRTLDSFDKYVKLREIQGAIEMKKLKWFQ